MTQKIDNRLLTTREAAAALGLSLRQVQTLIQRGKLPAEKMGRDYFIRESDLKAVQDRPKGRPRKSKPALPRRGGAK